MEEGENFTSFHLRGRASARLNDEQNRLVFKTPTWLILYMHGFSESIAFLQFFF